MRIRFPGGVNRCLTISYDDGVEQDRRLISLMKQYGIAGTFNLDSGLFSPEGTVHPEGKIHRRMTESQCKELYGNEPLIEVATHGFAHIPPDELIGIQQVNEIMDDRKKLEQMFGKIVRGNAYAHGRVGENTVQILRDCGIVYARTIRSTKGFNMPQNWLMLEPTCHHNDPQLMELAGKFLRRSTTGPLSMFYLWGHSYEFEEKNNWEVIENFFKLVSGDKGTWFATNIQIYEYMEAAKQLRFSADGRMIYNPTQITIWYVEKGENHSIEPGATVCLDQ